MAIFTVGSLFLATWFFWYVLVLQVWKIRADLDHLIRGKPEDHPVAFTAQEIREARTAFTAEELSSGHPKAVVPNRDTQWNTPVCIMAFFLLLFAAPAEAKSPRYRYRNWQRPVVYSPSPVYSRPTAFAPASNDAMSFLAGLNQWRASHGRGPVGWDANLAAYASRNSWRGHMPGSTGGAAQCWSPLFHYGQALAQFQASPPHAQILLSAQSAIGVSVCPTGITVNAR